MQAVPEELPDYAWASCDPVFAGLVGPEGWAEGLSPIVHAREVTELPDAPSPDIEPVLEPIVHPRVRVLGAYWHEGWPYAIPGAWLRPQARDRLLAAVDLLPAPFGLAVWDAWRDPRLQAILHDRVYRDGDLPPGFVAYPDPDPRRCPPHATGGTVDLTLTWRSFALSLGTTFDAFVPGAASDALEPGGPALERDLRRLLASVMSQAGFVQHPQEWWHWEYGTRYWAAITGRPVLFGHARLDQEPVA